MNEAEGIVRSVLSVQTKTDVKREEFSIDFGMAQTPKAVHESCLRSYGLFQLALDLLKRKWPHEAILVTLELAKIIAERKPERSE